MTTIMASRTPDFAIIGGGLVGASLALGLARLNQKVCILDEGDAGLAASRGNFGLVWVQGKGKGMPAYGPWTRWSADHWSEFAAELKADSDIDAVYQRPGGIMPALSEPHLHRLDRDLREINAQPGFDPYTWEVLSGQELRRRIPEIGQEVAGAIYCPEDGAANPLKLWRALHVALRRRSVSYHPNRRIRTIEPRGTGFRLTWDGGELHAGRVILAAGLGNLRLAPQVDLDAPVRPSRGHILVTERVRPFLKHLFLTIRQTEEGSVMIGDSRESAGLNAGLNTGILSAMADRAQRILPMLGRLNVIRSWSALRVMSPDGYPIYQQSPTFPGAWLVTCHSGVTLAAAHAKRLAHIIAKNESLSMIEPFSARRFHVSEAA